MENMENMEVMENAIDSEWGGEQDTPAEQQPTAETTTADQPEVQPEGQQGAQHPAADQPELFTLKNRDQTRQVTREELVAMAQKGWDYDQVRQERDQLRQYRQETDPALELLKSYAARSGMELNAYLDFCRKQELMAGGMTEQAAAEKLGMEKQRAELDRRQAEIDAYRAQQDSIAERARAQAEGRKKDIEAFFAAYPGVSPDSIPQEVWAAVRSGDRLTNAYTMYENRRLTAELAAERQNKRNQAAAPGSLGGGSVTEADEIDRLWAAED